MTRNMRTLKVNRLFLLSKGLLVVLLVHGAGIGEADATSQASVGSNHDHEDKLTSDELEQMSKLLHLWQEMGHLNRLEEEQLACLREKQVGVRAPGYDCIDGHYTQDRSDLVHNHRTKRSYSIETSRANSLYDTKFTDDNKRVLRQFGLFDKWMMRDKNVQPSIVKVKWTQFSRCWWLCEEEYYLVDYHVNGDKENTPAIKVFVAKSILYPPDGFSTLGYQGLLHFGFQHMGKTDSFFFVIHHNNWGPYQHRFMSNEILQVIQSGMVDFGSQVALGGVGGVVSAVAASVVAVGSVVDDYIGHYLRYIG